MENVHIYDMIVIGGGPGGYTAALYAARAGLDTLVLEKLSAGGQMAQTHQIDNYPGFEEGIDGFDLAEQLREQRIECEYADDAYLVLMITPENPDEDLEKLLVALGKNRVSVFAENRLPTIRSEQICSIRRALFAPHETVSPEAALGRICGAPTVSCPPAIPIAVSGERISPEMVEWFRHYGVRKIDVLK